LLGYLLGDGIITLQGTIFVLAFDVFFIISGLLVLFKGNTPTGRKHLAFGLVAVVLVILVIEGGLHLINLVVGTPNQETNPWVEVSARSPYQGEEWAETYFKQLLEVPSEYVPYVQWRTTEFHSEYINVDSSGVRKTWNPENHSGNESSTMYVFGGSTLWGMGARDDYTIPSHLSKLLHDDGNNFTVYNYGMPGYTFTQEIVRLTLLLREGYRPDYVVFYDGVNDVCWASGSGNPGTLYMESYIREKLSQDSQDRSSGRIIWETVTTILERHSMIYRLLGNIADVDPPAISGRSDEDLRLLSVGIAEYYLGSLELLDQLAQGYGFDYICYWQPVTCFESKLTEEEAGYAWAHNGTICKLYRMTADHLAARSPPMFFDVSDALDERIKTYYIDVSNHLSEEGNAMVATRVFEIFEDLFLQE
jgi:lysophospholipase L1-like esterase